MDYATCGKEMRTGACALDPYHQGRCSSVAFTCDGCGKRRRSQPVASGINPWDGMPEAAFCFMCVEVYARVNV